MLLVDARLDLVRDQKSNRVAASHRLSDREHFEPVFLGRLRGLVADRTDHDRNAAVAEVQGLSSALVAVADDGYCLVENEGKVGVVVTEHFHDAQNIAPGKSDQEG